MTETDEDVWCAERRREVETYLARQGLEHGLVYGAVGGWPAWFIAPHLSIWAIESVVAPGSVGWWAICGDVPTDYCSAGDCRHPRLAAKKIAERWLDAIASTAPSGPTIGDTGLDAELIPLLEARAHMLLEFVADASNWPD